VREGLHPNARKQNAVESISAHELGKGGLGEKIRASARMGQHAELTFAARSTFRGGVEKKNHASGEKKKKEYEKAGELL